MDRPHTDRGLASMSSRKPAVRVGFTPGLGTAVTLTVTSTNSADDSTRAGAGIGKAIAKKLGGQQLNVVLVALQDQLLDATHEELSTLYPQATFRKVCIAPLMLRLRCPAGQVWR